MNNDLFMNDTLDNFLLTQALLAANNEETKENGRKIPSPIASERTLSLHKTNSREISLDDSAFLEEVLHISSPSANTEQVLKETQNFCRRDFNTENESKAIREKNENEHSSKDDVNKIRKTFEENRQKNDLSKKDNTECNVIHANNLNEVSKAVDEVDFHKLSSWGLPPAVLLKYETKKLTSMFSWQLECLNNQDILKNFKNLVYSAPTSAGKTLVAEILAIKTVFERQKKVIFILPFVSIVREKMYYFQDLLGTSGIRVEGFMGSYNPPGGFSSVQIAICTIEKANNLINRLLEEKKLSEIGAILVDEMHLLGDPSRGYLLELLLTKLRYISQKDENIDIQIIGMSATLPNLNKLAKWLNAELFTTEFRPIPLHEQAIVCGEIYNKDLKLIRKLHPLPELGTDTDHILQLCLETIKDSCAVLIFCPTKNWCENLALQISSAFFKLGKFETYFRSS